MPNRASIASVPERSDPAESGELADRGPLARWWADRSLRSKGILVLAIPVTTLLIAGLVFLFVLVQTDRATDRVSRTHEAQEGLAQISILLAEGEAGVRAYLATGNREYLAPTITAREQLPGLLSAVGAAIGGDPEQAVRLGEVRAIVTAAYEGELPADVTTSPSRVRSWLADRTAFADQVRAALAAIGAAEDRVLDARLSDRDRWIDRARTTTVVALIVGVLGGIAAMAAFTIGVSRRLERLVARTTRLRQGEVPDFVDPGNDEIGVLSRRLTEVAARWLMWKSEAQEARVAAESANQAKSEFLSRMSHELRTPLNAVLGFAQLLELDAPPAQQDSVRQIRKAGSHLLTLINEVLDISRIEAGHLALSPEPVRLADVVGEVVELMGPIAADRRVAIHAAGALSCGCYALADRQRTKQVILNLVSNAVKYNNPGGTVVLSCAAGTEAAVLEVTDDGIGIATGDLDRLFIPFERLGAASSEIEGTGVGLAISQRLAAAMDGRIEVSSEVGRGSIFRLLLPTADPPELPSAEPAAANPADVGDRDGEDTLLTVLSIEDNPANIRLLQEIVNRRPTWRLVTAGHGRLGLDLAVAHPPHLILLDLHLPDMRGEEVLRRLRADDRSASIPVIVVSADATPGQTERLRAIGAEAYLTKPIEVTQLLALLDRVRAEVLTAVAGDSGSGRPGVAGPRRPPPGS